MEKNSRDKCQFLLRRNRRASLVIVKCHVETYIIGNREDAINMAR